MVVTLVITMTNNNEQRTMNCSKQTQSKPILSASGGFKRDLVKMGHHEFVIIVMDKNRAN